jgi:hypothetical protein
MNTLKGGRNGSHGQSACPDEEELGLLRAHWIIGPPFVDRKSLTTMSNAGGVGGWHKTLSIIMLLGTWVTNLVDKLCRWNLVSHSHASNAFSKRNASYWTVRVWALADFGCRWLSQLWRVTAPWPEIENLCGHGTGGIRVLIGEV